MQPGMKFGFQRPAHGPGTESLPLCNCMVQSVVTSVQVVMAPLYGPFDAGKASSSGIAPCLAWCWEVTLEIIYARPMETQ